MGNSNFNLDGAVNDYINQVNQQGSLTSSDFAELSAHLYDATEHLQRGGLTQEEAFIIACKRTGNEQLLTDEYDKVNPSIKTNKIWAYMLVGFNMFYAVPSIILSLLSFLYFSIHRMLGTSQVSIAIIIGIHLLVCAGIIWIVTQRVNLLRYVETTVTRNAVLAATLSFIPLAFVYFFSFIRVFGNANRFYLSTLYNSALVQNSYYLMFLVMGGAALTLVFSINKPGRLTLKSFFGQPSTLFLLLSGLLIECVAAFSRSLQIDNILTTAIAFGMVYAAASCVVTVYNRTNSINCLLKLCAFGFFAETVFGGLADIDRGNTCYTLYFVGALLLGTALGWVIGTKSGAKVETSS